MRIQNIRIENFGIFKDSYTFLFPYNVSKKVTLLIGENGSGKTTLLNAVKTVLYGSMLFGTKKNITKYQDFIRETLNSEAKKKTDSKYEIELEFVSNFQRFSGTFKILRKWTIVDGKFKETTIITKDGLVLSDSEIEGFFKLFYRTYPLELFELFYLDGEKIDQLSFFDSNIYNLIETSMNIDLFKYLKNDLESYAVKKHKDKRVTELESEKIGLLEKLEYIFSMINDENRELSEIRSKEIQITEELNEITKNIAQTNLSVPDKIREISIEIERSKKELTKTFIEVIPLLLLKNEIQDLNSTLKLEELSNKENTIKNEINEELAKYIKNKADKDISYDQINHILNIMKSKFETDIDIIHNISSDDYDSIKLLIFKLSLSNSDDIRESFDHYYELQSKVKTLNVAHKEYDEDIIRQQLDKMLKLQEKLTEVKAMAILIDEKISRYRDEIESIKKRISNIESEVWKALKSENINKVIGSIDTVIVEYIKRVKRNKIVKIEEYTRDMFGSLIRKKDFISNISIGENNIVLHNNKGDKIQVTSLSSGERQLFVLSIIYAIVRVSERNTPLIFDTLLGRLDKKHQQEVFDKFIANCPDQVVILATDSELMNISKNTIQSLTNTIYKIDFSKFENRIERIQ